MYLMMTNVMVKTCLKQEIVKISNFIQVKIKSNACRRSKFNQRPNLSEGRISPNAECPEVPKCGLNTRHDNREVTLTHLTQAQILRSDK